MITERRPARRGRGLLRCPVGAVLAALLLIGSVRADEVFVPSSDPSQGRGNAFPWFTFNAPEWRYQLLFTAQQLNTPGCAIWDIAFAPASTGIHVSTSLEMSMSLTTVATLVANWAANMPGPVVVFPAAPYTWRPARDAWSPIGLKSPFIYDGTSNLVVELRYLGGAVGGNFDGYCHSDAGIVRAWNSTTGAYHSLAATSFNQPYGLTTRFTVARAYIVASGTPRPGGSVILDLNGPADAGLPYQVGSSLGSGPIPLGNRRLELSSDALLAVSVGGHLPGIFRSYAGRLDARGKAQATIQIPDVKALIGVAIHSAFVTVDSGAPFGIRSIARPFVFSINS